MQAGRRDFEYMHLFYGPIESVDAAAAPPPAPSSDTPRPDRIGDLESRIEALERELEELKQLLSTNSH
jgi:uncharacterized protein YceH (UPF0502 family)